MKVKNRSTLIIFVTIVILFVFTTTIFAFNNSATGSTDASTSDKTNPAAKYTEHLVGSNYEDWKKAITEEVKKKSGKQLSKVIIDDLYEKGYSLEEIEKAEGLSILCGKGVEEVLEIKKTVKGQYKSKTNSEIWGEVEKQIGADIVSRMKNLKFPQSTVMTLKDKHFSDDQIVEIGVLASNYGLDFNKVASDMQSGKSYEQLDKQYWEALRNKVKSEAAKKVLSQKDLENTVKIKNGITDKDISLCKSYGINQILEVGLAKDLATRYKVELKYVAQLKQEKKSWSNVISVLEEEKR